LILVDSSIWLDHFRATDPMLKALLQRQRILIHPAVIGEIAMGSLTQRAMVLKTLADLPAAVAAEDDEVRGFAERYKLFGRGIGFGDAHLLASAKLTAGTRLWTRDKRLLSIAWALGLAAPFS
jgi:predicted nucleic acid-binding protein